jgi:trans-aconitate methyltransferase
MRGSLRCGTGHLTKLIAEAKAEVVGIDSSPEMVEAARAACPDIEFVVADAADFSFTEPLKRSDCGLYGAVPHARR